MSDSEAVFLLEMKRRIAQDQAMLWAMNEAVAYERKTEFERNCGDPAWMERKALQQAKQELEGLGLYEVAKLVGQPVEQRGLRITPEGIEIPVVAVRVALVVLAVALILFEVFVVKW